MNRCILVAAAFVMWIGLTLGAAEARGGIPIPIVWGHGEDVTELGELPPDVSQAVAQELGTPVTVGFLYSRAHLFWLDVWTWDGRHVLYSGDRYWEPHPSDWARITGSDPASKYGVPFRYRVPLFPLVVGCGVLVYSVRKRFFKTTAEKLEWLFRNPRYQRAIAGVFEAPNGVDAGKVITRLNQQKVERAVDQLVSQGEEPHTAEFNLRLMADVVLSDTIRRIESTLTSASLLDQKGHWKESAEIYDHVISVLPLDDERLPYARNCLAAVNQKIAQMPAQLPPEGTPPLIS